MARTTLALVAVAIVLIAAAGVALALFVRETPGEAVAETARKLPEVRSGDLSMRVRAAPRGTELERGVGFSLKGPFALAAPNRLPTADVTFTRVAGGNRARVSFVSTGREAFVTTAGQTYELDAARERGLRGAAPASGTSGGLGELDIEDWVLDPKLEEGPELGGAPTDRITSRLRVVEAANGLLELSGRGSQRLVGAEATRLAGAARSARLELLTGANDRLLRGLSIDLELSADVPAAVRDALGPLGGARFRLDLEVRDPNRAVRVAAPRDARPASELPSG